LADAGADAREQGKGLFDGPLAAVRFGLEAVAAPSLTRRCPIPRVVREGQQLTTMACRGSRSCSCLKDYQDCWKKIASVLCRSFA
jgi:hypothetical protein